MAPTERAKRFRKGAAKGSARDAYEFDLLHYSGEEGVRRNLPTAAEWVQKAATQGLAEAQAFLGSMYLGGTGVEQDMEQAVVWWRKAASQGNTNSQRNLACAYDKGGEGAHTRILFSSTFSGWFQHS
jgi:TPR repeat protein